MNARVLVTREAQDCARTAVRLAALGFEPVLLPLSETTPLAPRLPDAWQDTAAVAATSANAVRHAPGTLIGALFSKPVFAVGPRTADAARAAGFQDVIQGRGDAARLASRILAAEPSGPLLYLCGRVRRPEFEAALGAGGIEVAAAETYDTLPLPVDPASLAGRLDDLPVDAVLLHSALAARAFAVLSAHPLLRGATVFALSPRIGVASGASSRFAPIEPNEDALVALLARWAEHARHPGTSFPDGQTC